MIDKVRKHRATGGVAGRPKRIPVDIGKRILEELRERVDPVTGLVKPDWKGLCKKFGVSRTTIGRIMAGLRDTGAFESVAIPVGKNMYDVYYRLKA